MPDRDVQARASIIEATIPRPAADVARMGAAFGRMVSKQWQTHVPGAIRGCEDGIPGPQFAKGRFIAEMYARACYSMLLVSRDGPIALRIPIRAGAFLPPSRGLTTRLGSLLLSRLEQLLARSVHRRLLLTSALMGMLDVVLDDAAGSGEAAALRVASLTARPSPGDLLPAEWMIVRLACAAREGETEWQSEYWDRMLQPAVRTYCQAEAMAVRQAPDPTGMGHRSAGIEAAIKGMWYVTGPLMGLQADLAQFERSCWNREQHWMADTSLLMQMIDDWVDQDEDRGARITPVVAGDWTIDSAAALFEKTAREMTVLLDASGIQSPVLQAILVDLYKDYLHTAIAAMRTGVAA